MNNASTVRCGVYAAISLAALVATWSQNLAYTPGGSATMTALRGPVELFRRFTLDTAITPASRSITADIMMLFLAAAILMVLEARRHQIPFVWAYIAAGLIVAISVSFPLFLIARERRLAAQGSTTPSLGPLDTVLLTVLAVVAAAGTLGVDTR